MTTGVWWVDALIGLNIALLFGNLLFMICVYAENRQMKADRKPKTFRVTSEFMTVVTPPTLEAGFSQEEVIRSFTKRWPLRDIVSIEEVKPKDSTPQ